MTTTTDDRPIKIALGRKRYEAKTVNAALKFLCQQYSCTMADLTCDTSGPVYGGREIWVWDGAFDADRAASLFVPFAVYRRWLKHRGVCSLR